MGKIRDRRHRTGGESETPGPLTDREKEVLSLVACGMTNKEIAMRLAIKEKTVRNHVGRVIAKLPVSGREQAAQYATARGLAGSR